MSEPTHRSIPVPLATRPVNAVVSVPGSKSLTNRAFLTAALAQGESVISNALFSDDTKYFSECLNKLGVPVTSDPTRAEFIVQGKGGAIPNSQADLFVGNAGTAARLLPAMIALGQGTYRMDGVARMRLRPMADLLDALESLGAKVSYEGEPGCFPFTMQAAGLRGGELKLKANKTSQQLSALLMAAPYFAADTTIELIGELVSKPYIEMTRALMADFGVTFDSPRDGVYVVRAGGRYRAQHYVVEPDASGASYFYAMAALTGGSVVVDGLNRSSKQGDVRFVDVLAKMGCALTETPQGLQVRGPDRLRGVEVDMNDISDTVMTLAAIAPFAEGPTTIRNVEHIRFKETDRVAAVATELRRMGIAVDEFPDGMRIHPGTPHAATIETYDDHRMAMSFAITGLKTPGLRISDPECTGKTFPDFFDRFARALECAPGR